MLLKGFDRTSGPLVLESDAVPIEPPGRPVRMQTNVERLDRNVSNEYKATASIVNPTQQWQDLAGVTECSGVSLSAFCNRPRSVGTGVGVCACVCVCVGGVFVY